MRKLKIVVFIMTVLNIVSFFMLYYAERNTRIFERTYKRIVCNEDSDKNSFDYKARIGWENTIEKLHIDFDVAFFGNSITYGSDFQKAFPDKKNNNSWIPGRRYKRYA